MRLRRSHFGAAILSLLHLGAWGKKVSVKEVVFDSAVADIQWLGKDQKTVLVQTANGRLYRSTNGGDRWNEISDQLKATESGPPIVVDSLMKSPADEDTVVVVGKEHTHFVSSNGGTTWRRIRQQSKVHTLILHKTRAKWALVSTWSPSCEGTASKKRKGDDDDGGDDGPCTHMLFITKDLCKTFNMVTSYVLQFAWGSTDRSQEDRIYLTHFRQKSGDQPRLHTWSNEVDFGYSDDGGKKINRLVTHGNKFLISHKFIFVAKLKDLKKQTVSLLTSSDGAATFKNAKLPQELDEKSYTVLDTSESAVIIHVNHGSPDPPYQVGNVYISDAEGVQFTLSLPNNVRSSSGDCEFDKVLSLEGIYLANFKDSPKSDDSDGKAEVVVSQKAEAAKEAQELENEASAGTEVDKRRSPKAKNKDESIVRTVITFDKGGVWSYLKPPKVDSLGAKLDCPPDRCWLHLHGVTNFHNYAPFYSTENAVGIIMGTGNVGPYLRFEPDQINTYLSRDGGLTWVEAHKGAFIYEFGDHGGLVVMADDIRKTKQVVFSWNEGHSWFDFDLSEFPLEVDNIVTEPNATSTKFLLYGTRGDAGVMYHLDFEALGQPLCKGVWAADSVSSDYETWSPSDGRSEKCMLGRQVTYTRRKQEAECFNGEKFERPVTRKNCECTEENFECAMGFARKVGSMECKFTEDGTVPIPPTCTSSDYFQAVAHRKVVGDSCEGGWQPSKVSVPCPASARLSRGAVSVLGTVFMVSAIMGAVTFLSRSERFKGVFANYGFDSFGAVQYTTIGGKTPETALESCGTRFDTDFIEGDQDDFDADAPQLMQYTGGGDRDRDRGNERDRDFREGRRAETAASQVPKLARPPGAGAGAAGGGDDGLDLL